MNVLSISDRVNVVRCLVDGCSMRATSRITGVARNTIDKLLLELGTACSAYQDLTLRNLSCKRIQVDECWAFVGCKQKQVTAEKVERDGIVGDVWTWAAIDADTKLIPCWSLGQRDAATAAHFVDDLAGRLTDRVQLTSDGLNAYLGAVERAFQGAVDYAMLIKVYGKLDVEGQRRYSPATCIGCEIKAVTGNPDPDHISTSYIERANLTMRMGMRRFTRLTNAFSKKLENHAAAVSLHMMHYNFARVHQTLKTTPAVAAGVADHVRSIEEIVSLLDSN
ncbi:MAG: IS1 family transposase [Bryobacteraceae bacterium]